MRNIFTLIIILFINFSIAFSQVTVKQTRDCFGCQNNGKSIVGNCGIFFVNTDKKHCYYLHFNEWKFVSGDDCFIAMGATEQVRLRPNDGGPGSTYAHQIDFNIWPKNCCPPCEGSVKTAILYIPLYDCENKKKVGDVSVLVKGCCGKKPFCSGVTDVIDFEKLINSELNILSMPNPASEQIAFNYNFAISGVVKLEIYDAFGKLVDVKKQTSNIGDNSITINLDKYASSDYYAIFEIATTNNIYVDVAKFVVVK